MKTYSRKNSSYLKKAFIGSNFNEMCRLCLSEVDMVLMPIFQDSQMSYQELIQYSVDVLVEEGDGLPPNICEECLSMIEQIYIFKKKCKSSDSKLREHFQLMDSVESKLTDTQFEVTENVNEICEASQNIHDLDKIDPGGITETNSSVEEESSNSAVEKTSEVHEDEEEVINQDDLKPKNVEKDIVKSFNEENIVINEVKRYVWKNESTGEKDATVCEVVHYDIQNEVEDDEDENSFHHSFVRCYSSAEILQEYSNNLKDPSADSDTPTISMFKSKTDSNCSIASMTDEEEAAEKSEGKIQELYQLWGNDDEVGELGRGDEHEMGEIENGRNEEEEALAAGPNRLNIRTKWKVNKTYDGKEELEEEGKVEAVVPAAGGTKMEGVEQGETRIVHENREGLVVDVSWEDTDNTNIDTSCEGVVEVKLEENGVIRTHKVFTSENCIQFIQPEREKNAIQCFLCNEEFKTRKEMKIHLFSTHAEAANNSFCEICLKNFTSTNSLKRHMLVHTGVKPYGCEICGRKFSQSSILKRHRYTHGKKKPFECNFCQKSYTQKMNLLSHMRNHGIKSDAFSHRCKFCQKSFVHPSGLSRHLKQHKGVKFTCDQCKKTFSDSSALARHIKSSHA